MIMNAHINFEKIDRSNMLQLITGFPQQFRKGREIGEASKIDIKTKEIKNIFFAGMGGSAIGGDLIISCLGQDLKIPAFVVRNYYLPVFVDRSSLVIVSSFSGNTEESLSCYDHAREKGTQVVCISSGGELSKKAKADNIPLITIPGGIQPRAALGYLSVPLLVMLTRTGLVQIEDQDFDETEQLLENKKDSYSPDAKDNFALSLANRLKNKIPVLYSAVDFLQIVGNRWKGQFSENAKVLAFCNVFPELNHNEIVGWERLPEVLSNFQIIYLRDEHDFSRTQKRMKITQDILERVTSPIIELWTEGNSRLARLFSLIYLGDWVSYYLAIINGIDPTRIDKINLLKNQLKLHHDSV